MAGIVVFLCMAGGRDGAAFHRNRTRGNKPTGDGQVGCGMTPAASVEVSRSDLWIVAGSARHRSEAFGSDQRECGHVSCFVRPSQLTHLRVRQDKLAKKPGPP
jgi:hypothetical protein